MTLLPKFVLFKEQGIQFALQTAQNAFHHGISPFVIQHPNPQIGFCDEVQTLLKRNFPIASITGTTNRLTVTFKHPNRK